MLSPRYLDGLSDEIIEIYSQLETDILQDMARRIARLGKITDTTRWQAQMLAEAGGLQEHIRKTLKKYDAKTVRAVTAVYKEALEKNAANDNRIFAEALGRTISAPNAQAMLSTIQKCHSDLSRLTLTTAATSQQQFVREANRVYIMTQSGAFDYDTAMKDAADALSKQGLYVVEYETQYRGKDGQMHPVKRSIESAVRMNILTSINQTAANQTLSNAEELGVEKFEVTAHIGARPEHEAWQGKIYTKEELYSVCGLGEVDGLCGINCRHSFYPYFEGMEKHYTQDDLDEMASEKVAYTDKDGNKHEMTRYEAEQRERQIERNIRKYKRQALTEEAAGADNTQARRKLGEWQAAARDFTKQTGIQRDSAREYIGTGGKQPTALKPVVKQNLTTASATTAPAQTTTPAMNGKAEVFLTATKNAASFVNKATSTQTMTPIQTASIAEGKRLEMALQSIKPKVDDIKDIVKLQGFDGKPTVLSKDDFLKAVKDDTFIAQRTYTADTRQKLADYVDMLRNGEFYVDCRVGGKAHGKGMYCAADFTKGKKLQYIVDEMGHYQEIGMYQRGEQWTMTETIALHPSAKIIQECDVRQFYKDYLVETYWESKKNGGTMTTKELKRLITQSESRDVGVLAASMGFDAIRADKVYRGADYVVVLNRTKLILLGGAK